MEVKEFIGEKKVLSSGTVISPKEEQISLQVDTGNNLQFTVEFKFLSKQDDKQIEVNFDNNKLTITNHGIPSGIGSGPSQLIEIGTTNGKKMWLYYISYAMFDGEFIKIEYAFYEG